MPSFERAEADWLSYADALGRILEHVQPGPVEAVALEEAKGRYAAEAVKARATLPPFDNSAMDGFAVRSADVEALELPGAMPVAGLSLPGTRPLPSPPPGAAVRIMTGGPLPTGYDTVIRVEDTDGEATEGRVVIESLRDLKKHIRPAGQDLRRGQVALPAGSHMGPGAVAVALACGVDRVAVHAPARVGVLSTGDELVETGDFERVVEGEGIPDTNRRMLLAAIRYLGCLPVDLGAAPDDEAALHGIFEALPTLDALVTTGGASMGERDLLKRVLQARGMELAFWRARIRPGSPVSFGHLPTPGGRLPLFGLPGNPASAFVTFAVFVAPFLGRRMGSPSPFPSRIRAVTADSLDSPARLTHFFRVGLSWKGGDVVCALTGPQGSGLVSPLLGADGLAIVDEGISRVDAGNSVEVVLLPWGRVDGTMPTDEGG